MSKAKLSVFVSDLDEPCKISNRTWYVTIYHCDGSVLDWCGKRYLALPARCGHLEVEVPPGCYYIRAVWGFWVSPVGVFWGNHFTDTAIVQACCDKTTCVTVFTPKAHRCGILFNLAVQDMVAQRAIDADLGKQVDEVVKQVIARVEAPDETFELAHLKELEEAVRAQEKANG